MASAEREAPQPPAAWAWEVGLAGLAGPAALRHRDVFGTAEAPEPWVSEPARDHVVEEDLPAFDAAVAAALAGGPLVLDVRVRTLDCDTRWYSVRGVYQRDGAGRPSRLAGVTVDLTETQRERQLGGARAPAADHAFLLELSDAFRLMDDEEEAGALATRLLCQRLGADLAFVGEFDEAGEHFELGPGFAAEGGPVPSGSLRRSATLEVMAPLDEGPHVVPDVAADERLSAAAKRRLLGGRMAAFVTVPLHKGPRNPIWSLTVMSTRPRRWQDAEVRLVTEVAERTWSAMQRARAAAALRASREELARVNASLEAANRELERLNHDLERQVAERTEALRRSQLRFQQAFEVSPVAACMTTEGEGRVVDVNRAFTRLTGYDPDEVVGRTLTGLGLFASRADRDLMAAVSQHPGPFEDVELRLRCKDGTVRDVLASGDRLRLDEEYGWLRLFLDVSEQKRSQEELMQAIKQVMTDTTWFSRRLVERLAQVQGRPQDGAGVELLSERERQVLARISQGKTNEEIAAELDITPRTVRNHLANVYQKIDVHSRAEAVVWARERGLAT